MHNDRPAGFALIGGTAAGLLTMAFHPTGHALLGDFDRVARINQTVHALAIAGTILTTYGLLRLTRLIESRRAVTDAAMVFYAFGAVAVMFAAITSGFIGTDLAAQILAAGGDAQTRYEPVRDFSWALNQSTTRVFVVTASVGIALWSVAMLNEPAFGRAIGLTGILIGAGAVIATIAGMPMDIHGFGAIVLGHGIWLIWTATKLLKRS
jgi:hypothetical protein